MDLIGHFQQLTTELDEVFCQKRTVKRASRLMIAIMLCLGRRWITRLLCVMNLKDVDWSTNYKLFSRSRWSADKLFIPAIRRSIEYMGKGPIVIAGDETRLARGGRKVKRSKWTRDPMSPPFHVNFIKGIRWVQFSALLPLHRDHAVDCRGIPVCFRPVDSPIKPRKNASPEQLQAYKKARKINWMCTQTLDQLRWLRHGYDEAGAAHKKLLVVLDGGFCNQTMLRAELDHTELLVRTRKDAKLCLPDKDPNHPRRVYSPNKFTPEQVRKDESIPYKIGKCFFGGKYREIRYKEIETVLWQGGARRRKLRLIVVAPTPYRTSSHSRRYYRNPGYLLSTDRESDAEFLLQCYLDRWQIEVNHRDEKQHIGIADAQVWNDQSVDRLPAFMVASYSFLLLAALQAYGPRRTNDYIEPPKWQKRRTRPSCQDLLAVLREQAIEQTEKGYNELGFKYDPKAAVTLVAA